MVFIVLFCTYINKLYYYFNVLLNSCENKFQQNYISTINLYTKVC